MSVVEVSGDVDMAVAGEFTEVLQPLVTHKDVVLDLRHFAPRVVR